MNITEALRIGRFSVRCIQDRIHNSAEAEENDGDRCFLNDKWTNLALLLRKQDSELSAKDFAVIGKCLELRLAKYNIVKPTDPGWYKVRNKVERLENALLTLWGMQS